MKWINVNERLPGEGRIVLCVNERNLFIGYLDRYPSPKRWQCFDKGLFDLACDGREIDVTHWCEIPDLPEVKKM